MTPSSRPGIVKLVVLIGLVSITTASALIVAGRTPSARTKEPISAPPGSKVAVAAPATPAGIEIQAVGFAARTRSIPTRDGSFDDPARYCPSDRLRVVWAKPDKAYQYGAFIEPLGPEPVAETTSVNGIVICEGSSYAYMGFEAIRTTTGAWEVLPVPDIGGEDDPAEEPPADTPDPGLTAHATPPAAAASKTKAKTVTGATGGALPSPAKALTAAIEPYAGYDAQSTCDPTPKKGVLAFRKLVLAANPQTRSLGITRACSAGGRSEHKEGRAWDWGTNINRPAERAAADNLIAWLFATDSFGNDHAMIRRLGIMYMVYNRRIWGAYRADQGWRAYSGANPHTDHVHFSFARPGANGITSFWTGVPATMPGGSFGGGSGGGGGGDGGGENLVSFRGDGNGQGSSRPDGHDWRDPGSKTNGGTSGGTGGGSTDWPAQWPDRDWGTSGSTGTPWQRGTGGDPSPTQSPQATQSGTPGTSGTHHDSVRRDGSRGDRQTRSGRRGRRSRTRRTRDPRIRTTWQERSRSW